MARKLDFMRLISGRKLEVSDRRIAPWAELATSENNSWMKAIRLHESGNYEQAYLQYMLDAKNCLGTSHYEKASLSFRLAADCLESIGRQFLASQISELARRCDEHQVSWPVGSEVALLSLTEDCSKEQNRR